MKDNPLTTTITYPNGETNTCLLKEKVNNENGQLIYRFHNQDSGEEYLLVRYGNDWTQLNNSRLPAEVFKALCEFGDQIS